MPMMSMPKRSNGMATDDADGVDATEVAARSDAEGEVDGEGHRRRRRRRGGRGRGRGRGQDREVPTEAGAPGVASAAGSTDDEDEDDEELDAYPAPRTPQASTFGSVWDSQIGVPSAPLASADLGGPTADDEDEDEPEIPEYLLAERRQRAGRPGGRPAQPGRGRGGRPGGRGGAYQSAVDRERYGRSGGSAFGGNGGNSNVAPRSDRGPRPDRGPRYGSGSPRPDRGPRTDRPPTRTSSAPPSGDPWSEVPPELEEMLRAELARKGAAPRGAPSTEATAGADAKPKSPGVDATSSCRGRDGGVGDRGRPGIRRRGQAQASHASPEGDRDRSHGQRVGRPG